MTTEQLTEPAHVLDMTEKHRRNITEMAARDPEVPLSLMCYVCDAGTEIDTLEKAGKAGWRGIAYDPDGLSWNFIGHCPECKETES